MPGTLHAEPAMWYAIIPGQFRTPVLDKVRRRRLIAGTTGYENAESKTQKGEYIFHDGIICYSLFIVKEKLMWCSISEPFPI
jgi:hypothetical protein